MVVEKFFSPSEVANVQRKILSLYIEKACLETEIGMWEYLLDLDTEFALTKLSLQKEQYSYVYVALNVLNNAHLIFT